LLNSRLAHYICNVFEFVIATILSLVAISPSFSFTTCGVSTIADWYTTFYNPRNTACDTERVYPLYTLVLIFYGLYTLLFLIIRIPTLLIVNRVYINTATSSTSSSNNINNTKAADQQAAQASVQLQPANTTISTNTPASPQQDAANAATKAAELANTNSIVKASNNTIFATMAFMPFIAIAYFLLAGVLCKL